jgi:hypothetical protein
MGTPMVCAVVCTIVAWFSSDRVTLPSDAGVPVYPKMPTVDVKDTMGAAWTVGAMVGRYVGVCGHCVGEQRDSAQ